MLEKILFRLGPKLLLIIIQNWGLGLIKTESR